MFYLHFLKLRKGCHKLFGLTGVKSYIVTDVAAKVARADYRALTEELMAHALTEWQALDVVFFSALRGCRFDFRRA